MDAVTALLDSPLVINRTGHLLSALQNEELHKISFRDGLILAAAESGGSEILYTEDLHDGQRYGNVLVRNPFRSAGPAVSSN